MGYMGFGMKKENYTRKPHKAFEKYKDLYEQKTIRSGACITKGAFYISGSGWIDVREKKWLKITKAAFIFTIALIVIYVLAIDPYIKKIQRQQFEQTYFEGFYQTGKERIQKLAVMYKPLPHVYKMELSFYGQLSVVVKSDDFVFKHNREGGDNIINLADYSHYPKYQDFSVENGVLFVDRTDKRYYVLDHWAIFYDGDINTDEHADAILSVLKLKRSELEELICDLQDLGLRELQIDDRKRLHLTMNLYAYGTYEVIVRDGVVKAGTPRTQLDDNVFWRRDF